MRVLVFTQYYPPEVGATQTRLNVFARSLVTLGHEVTVVCEIPNHPKGIYFADYPKRWYTRTVEEGIETIRVFVFASPTKTFLRRLAFYVSYMVNAILVASLVYRRRPNVVFASSPPLFVAVAGMVTAALKRVPYVMDVRDLWPAAAVALGELRDGWPLKLAGRLERFLYSRAAAITCVTRSFLDYIEGLGIERRKLHHLPNGTLPEVFRPLPRDAELARGIGLGDCFAAGFLGNHGVAQGLDTLLEAATLLREEMTFLFVGDGPVKSSLQERAARGGVSNAIFLPQVPLEEAASYAALCDVLLVPLTSDPVFSMFVPSKMFDFLACGKPVVLMVGGEAAALLQDSGGGVVSPPDDPETLARVLLDLKRNPDALQLMGKRGREFVLATHDRSVQTRVLEEILLSVGWHSRTPSR